MHYENGKCDICDKHTKVIISTNKLAKNICASCLVDSVDMESSEAIKRMSETLEIPFSLKEYYSLLLSNLNDKEKAMDEYLEYLKDASYETEGVFQWDEIDKHYHSAKAFIIALAEITPLKDALTERGQEKWGYDYTFHEIVKLEQMYENTVKQYNVTSKIAQDAVKKASRLSVKMDALIASNDFKSLKEASSSMMQFLKTANIENLAAIGDESTIRTVADLVNYLEKNGFQYTKDMPNVPQDEIDVLMDNYVDNLKDIIYNATGLEVQIKDFVEEQKKTLEKGRLNTEIEESPLLDIEDFDEDYWEEESKRLDQILEAEDRNDPGEFDDDIFY